MCCKSKIKENLNSVHCASLKSRDEEFYPGSQHSRFPFTHHTLLTKLHTGGFNVCHFDVEDYKMGSNIQLILQLGISGFECLLIVWSWGEALVSSQLLTFYWDCWSSSTRTNLFKSFLDQSYFATKIRLHLFHKWCLISSDRKNQWPSFGMQSYAVN